MLGTGGTIIMQKISIEHIEIQEIHKGLLHQIKELFEVVVCKWKIAFQELPIGTHMSLVEVIGTSVLEL